MSVLGLDVGTSSCKAIVIDEKGQVLAYAQRGYAMSAPYPGRLEVDPAQLWHAVQASIQEVAAAVTKDPISVLSIATMGDSFVPVDGRGEPVGNYILASDVRSTGETELLVRELGYERIFEITGMPPHPINTLTKIFWIKNNDPDSFARTAQYLCAEEFGVSRLGLSPTTSYSNACRTMAFDIKNEKWSVEMMGVVGLTEECFPAAVPSGQVVGEVPGSIATSLQLPKGVKVVSGGMDQACGALGVKAVRDGIIEDSLGTVEAISFTIERSVVDGQLRRNLLDGHYSINCHVIGDKYLIMALVLSAGSTLRWFGENFGRETTSMRGKGLWDLPLSDEGLVPTRLIFLPYLAGSGTPTMNPLARGILMGLDLGINRDDLLKAILQGIVHEVAINVNRLERLGVPIEEIRCVGGGSKSDYWLQLRADMLARPVLRMSQSEAAVVGAALLAGIGGGIWRSVEEALEYVVRVERVFEPHAQYQEFYQLQNKIYRELYQRTADLFHQYTAAVDSLDSWRS
jgi:xylulokinase